MKVSPRRAAAVATRRAATVLASVAMLTALLASPAGASTTSYEAANPIGLLPALLLFIGGPIVLFLLIWLLVVAGKLSRTPSQESDLAWFHDMTRPDDSETEPLELEGRESPQHPELPESEPVQAAEPVEAAEPVHESGPVTQPSGSTRVTPGG